MVVGLWPASEAPLLGSREPAGAQAAGLLASQGSAVPWLLSASPSLEVVVRWGLSSRREP